MHIGGRKWLGESSLFSLLVGEIIVGRLESSFALADLLEL